MITKQNTTEWCAHIIIIITIIIIIIITVIIIITSIVNSMVTVEVAHRAELELPVDISS